MDKNKKIIIATGGTGGHVFPAYGLFKNLKDKKYHVELVTDKRGIRFLEKYKDIKLNNINTDSPFKKNPIKIFISIIKIIFALFKSLNFLIKFKPNIVFGMGGYSSFPICLAAYLLRIPFVIYENNLYLGKANRILLPFAYKLFISYADIEGLNKKYNKKIVLTGNILREEILSYNNENKRINQSELGILILGGSQAAKIFAEKLPNIFKQCFNENIKFKIFQQCLQTQEQELKRTYESMKLEYEIFNFNLNLFEYFSKIDFAITRSGSSMIAELVNCNVPFISIPLPSSADNHQFKNAKYFEKKGLGFLIREDDIEKKLFSLIKSIHKDKDLLKTMKIKQKEQSNKEVFKIIDKEINGIFNEQH